MDSAERKVYNKDYYKHNKDICLLRQRIKTNSLKNFSFEKVYDFYLHVNRPLKKHKNKNSKVSRVGLTNNQNE